MATSVGQVFEVYASKSEADAKALASSKPGAMCFTTDTHRIVFNGVVYNLVEIINNLTDGNTNKALSAAMGKKLQDEKLAKTDVVNGLMSDATDKPLSAAQGKYLNSLLMDNKLLINYGGAQNSTDDTTIQSYMGTDSTTFYNRLMRGATLIDVSTDNWIINIQEVSTSKVVLAGVRFQSYSLYANVITITISGGKFTNLVTSVANRYMPSVINNLTSSDTANALSAAQGKILNDKISALGSVYRIKGSKTNISDVLALTDAKVGDAWNVTNAFTFGGESYPANTNVVCITATSSSDHDENNWDPIGGTVDLSPYAKKDEIVNDLTSTDTDKPLSAAQGKVLQDEKLSKNDASGTYATKTALNDAAPYVLPGNMTGFLMGTLTTAEDAKKVFGTPKQVKDAWTAGKVFIGNRDMGAGVASTNGGIPLTVQQDSVSNTFYVVAIDTLIQRIVSFRLPYTDDSTWKDATNYKSSDLHPETGIKIQ